MYNKYLEIFVQVADTGSFSKAAEKLYISPTAIMKQMNLMEQDLGLSLLIRTNHGIRLTEAGKQIYKDCQYIIDYSNKAVEKAKKMQNQGNHSVTIGTSLICPCKPLLDIWYQINDKYPEFKIKIIPFEENHTNILNTLNSNGIPLDFVVSPCDSPLWLKNFNFLKLGNYKFCIAVPLNHPLSQKDTISFKDLSGEKVTTITTGDSKKTQDILNNIKNNCKDVEIYDAPFFYDINVFNRCEENGSLLVSLECWNNVHPAFKTIPLDSGETTPYGILYSKTPTDDALKFIEIIRNTIEK